MIVKRKNILTGKINEMEMEVTEDQISAWMDGQLIQNAMPDLTPTEREFFISGLSAEEQKEIFGE